MRKRVLWTTEDDDILKNKYPLCKTKDLVQILNRSLKAIEERARKYQIKKVDRTNGNKKGDVSRLLTNDIESYYWMGFIYADGSISKTSQLVVTLSSNDDEHLCKLAKYLNTTVHYINNDKAVTLAIQDYQQIPMICEKFGLMPRKTYSCVEPPKGITREQALAIIIGFIDGDGHRRKRSYNIDIANYKTWEPFYKWMEESIGCVNIRVAKTRPNVILCTLYKAQILELTNVIKNHNLPVLQRKWPHAFSKTVELGS